MRKIESYGSPEQVRERILQLREEGVSEDAITVVAKEGLHDTAFNDYDVNFKKAEGSAWDKFVSFFTGDDSEDRVVEDLNLSPDEEAQYKRELEQGGILLYVNDYGSHSRNENDVPRATGGAYYNTNSDDNVTAGRVGDNNELGARDEAAYGRNSEVDKDRAYADRRNDRNVDEERIELQEERLNVDKDRVQTGEVDIDKHVETDHQEFDVPVEREEVTIERRDVKDHRPAGKFDGENDEIHIPVSEERVNVSKENVVDEEVVVRKETVQDTEHVSEDVRREELDVNESYDDNRRRDYTDTDFERESRAERRRDDDIVDNARRDNDRF